MDEYRAEYGRSLVCAYARIGGFPCGIVANQKKLTQRSANTQFRAYQIKETYVRTGPQAVERVWKIVGLKPGTTDIVANPIEAIQGKNVLLLATLIDKGTTVERLFNSLAKFNPKNLKVAVAF